MSDINLETKIIYKYKICDFLDFGIYPIVIPDNAKILSIKRQNENLVAYAIFNKNKQKGAKTQKICIVGTGWPLPDEITNNYVFWDTIIDDSSGLVYHIFMSL